MNFVVFVDAPSVREWVHERTLSVAEKHPSRVIFIDAASSREGADLIPTQQQTVTHTSTNERVELSVGSLDPNNLAGLLDELRLREVPTVLWWAGKNGCDDPRFQDLRKQATRVVVDSSLSERSGNSVRSLANALALDEHQPVFDLAYLRLDPWREMIAQFFDNDDSRQDLSSITAVEIDSGSEAEAIYLSAWLSNLLHWSPTSHRSFRSQTGHTITFLHRLRGELRRVLRVVLTTDGSEYHAEVSENDPSVVSLSITGVHKRAPWLVPLQSIDNLSLIERAILAPAIDPVFFNTLRITAGMQGR
jgi:glucose-6-phosphate dehydrogenase assembly protein OpcA